MVDWFDVFVDVVGVVIVGFVDFFVIVGFLEGVGIVGLFGLFVVEVLMVIM